MERAPAQTRLLGKILDIQERGDSVPTLQELADIVGTAKSQVQGTVSQLIKKGYLVSGTTQSGRRKARTLEATAKAWAWRARTRGDAPPVALTMVRDITPTRIRGTVGAGEGRVAEDGDAGEHLSLPTQHVRGREVFMLEIAGDSMAGDELRTGDHIIVDPNARWDDGDMVVVFSEGTVTVKRSFRSGVNFVLEPSNEDHAPIILRPGWEHLGGQAIQGKVIGRVLWHVQPGRRRGNWNADG